MFWFDKVNRDENSLLYKFYKAQKIKPVKNDWIQQIEKEKKILISSKLNVKNTQGTPD